LDSSYLAIERITLNDQELQVRNQKTNKRYKYLDSSIL
jgi:hypothetical protein